eukprot:TRINITY_DN26043_c0_g1_i1.p1 TRINITY_DN26043_c0_g1~~TRINITY_DN26043_c0_g1_i1.p1  ORF type:complete len:733 (-),score=175.06 TRINITY_DN26043_c0_g1_i1:45-1988(-)
MGFIAPSDGSADVFVHRSNLKDGQALVVGASVMFEPGWDAQKNKPIAQAVVGAVPSPGMAGAVVAAGGAAPPPLANGQPGTVKAWMEDRGMGFISPSDGSADCFVHRSALVDGTYLVIGAPVMFEPGWDQQKGKPIAKAVSGAMAAGGAPAIGGPGQWGGGGGKGGGALPNGQPGTVKAWMENRGMGFISSADGSTDYFVHRSALVDGGQLIVGSQVMFEAGWDQQKNKPIATKCTGAVGPMADGGCGGGGCGGFGGGCGFGGGGYGGPGAGGMDQQSGCFKVWFPDKGFGFITLDNGQGDAFCGSSAIPSGMVPQEGMHVMFTCEWNAQKAKYTVLHITGSSGGGFKGGGKGGGKGGEEGPSDNCFVSGLPLDITEQSLQEIFSSYGSVVSCKVLASDGRPDKAALVRFGSVQEAKWIVDTINGNMVPGVSNPIQVKFATTKHAPAAAAGGGGGGKGGWGGGWGGGGGGGGSGGGQVQAAQTGTVKAVMENSLIVTPMDGGPDLYVPRSTLLDGSPEVGGFVAFQQQGTGGGGGGGKGGWGKAAPSPGMDNRWNPYAGKGGDFNHGGCGGGQGTGTVKAWMENRGMGFIAPNDGSPDLFVHRSYLLDGGSLVVGATVSFTSDWDAQKGKAIAKNVTGAVPQPAPNM